MDADTQKDSAAQACPGCALRDREIAELRERLAKLEAEVRGDKRQAAPFTKGPPKTQPKKPGRKSGDDYGTHHRRATPLAIDEVLDAPLPARCPFCSGEVSESEVVQQYQTEIPRQAINRQFNIHVGECTCCKKRLQGRHPLQTSDAIGAAANQIGPDAQALAVQLNKEAGLSHGKIIHFFQAAFDLELSRAAVCRIMLRAGRRCEPVYETIIEHVQQSPLIVPDETGWRIGGLSAWLHVAVGEDATAYLVHYKRGYEAAIELIGPDYEGFLAHDGWSPYEKFIYATHQTCLGHLLRRAHKLEDAAVGSDAEFPRQVKEILKNALAVRDQREAGELTLQQAKKQAQLLRGQIEGLVAPRQADPDNERFAKFLSQQLESLFTFMEYAGVDATNYKAEQAIRPAVVNRKVWGGNRTEDGAKAQSILASVFRTAAQHGVDAINFMSEALRATLGHLPTLFPDTT